MVGISFAEPAIINNKQFNTKLGANIGRVFNRFLGKFKGAGLPKVSEHGAAGIAVDAAANPVFN